MNKFFLILALFGFLSLQSRAQNSSFLILGDMHYDLLDDHDMDWLKTKPDDLRQVEEYTDITEENWDDFMAILHERVSLTEPPVKMIVQLGDLSEGLAGSEEKAKQMASNTIKATKDSNMPVPWIITKGNHDITGPGAKEAFQEFYLPFFRNQTGNSKIESANYSYHSNNVKIVCIDPWDQSEDMLEFLEKELSATDAKYKFVAVHEPVIPVTERCWYIFRKEPEKREALLKIIASNKAIVLCGHLHRYSVVSRRTNYGPIVQLMCNSVIRDREYKEPSYLISEYGPSLAVNKPEWQAESLELRKEILSEEAEFVSYFKQTDLPGYAIIKIDDEEESISLEYYAAFGDAPYDMLELSEFFSLPDHQSSEN